MGCHPRPSRAYELGFRALDIKGFSWGFGPYLAVKGLRAYELGFRALSRAYELGFRAPAVKGAVRAQSVIIIPATLG